MLKFDDSESTSASSATPSSPPESTRSTPTTSSSSSPDESPSSGELSDDTPGSNHAAVVGSVAPTLRYAAFSHDGKSFSLATAGGYALYSCWPWSLLHSSSERCGIVEMMFSTSSLIALAGTTAAANQPDFSETHLKLINFRRQTTISGERFPSPICRIRMNRKRMVVLLEKQIYVYDMATMVRSEIVKILPNPRGVIALSPSSENCFIAYPGDHGKIVIHDAVLGKEIIVIAAHKSPVESFTFNIDGTLLASVSTTGTIVKVFDVPSGTIRALFRRGSYSAVVSCLTFNADSTLLAAASMNGSVHIFRLPSPASPSASVYGYAWSMVTYFMPQSLYNIVEPVRSNWLIRLPVKGIPSLCAFGKAGETETASLTDILIFCGDGALFQYEVPAADGQECALLSTKNLIA